MTKALGIRDTERLGSRSTVAGSAPAQLLLLTLVVLALLLVLAVAVVLALDALAAFALLAVVAIVVVLALIIGECVVTQAGEAE
jgi:uncharacterized membrane protein